MHSLVSFNTIGQKVKVSFLATTKQNQSATLVISLWRRWKWERSEKVNICDLTNFNWPKGVKEWGENIFFLQCKKYFLRRLKTHLYPIRAMSSEMKTVNTRSHETDDIFFSYSEFTLRSSVQVQLHVSRIEIFESVLCLLMWAYLHICDCVCVSWRTCGAMHSGGVTSTSVDWIWLALTTKPDKKHIPQLLLLVPRRWWGPDSSGQMLKLDHTNLDRVFGGSCKSTKKGGRKKTWAGNHQIMDIISCHGYQSLLCDWVD